MTTLTAFAELLDGIRIIDLSRNLPGPFCSRLLAGFGAHIIKVEPPEGDPSRSLPPLFEALNVAKEELRVDFRSEGDLAGLRDAIAGADVVLDSFRPGLTATMGLDHARLSARNPRLVAVSITGYGASGAWAPRAGHDLNFMAMSGALDQMRTPSGELALPNVQWGDLAGGADMAATAVLAGLIRAGRSGKGVALTISMTHGLYAHLVMPLATRQMLTPLLGHAPGAGEDLLNGGLPCYSIYKTADGRHLAVAALEHKFWRAACEGFDRPDWTDRHWQRGTLPGSAASIALAQDLTELVGSDDIGAWTERFTHVDACVTPVLTLAEAGDHAGLALSRTAWVN